MSRRRPAESENELRWLTTYGDVVTLVLAFFVMLFAISSLDTQKFAAFVSGLDAFGNPAAATREMLDSGGALVGDFSFEAIPEVSTGLTEVTTTTAPSGEAAAETDFKELAERIQAEYESAGFPTAIGVTTDQRGLVVSIATDQVLFATGSADLSKQGERIVGVLAPVLGELPNQIMVEGHTDTVPTARAGYDNWDLSVDRAVAVVHLLESRHSITPGRLAATGYGEHQPRADNDTSQGRSRNRRVEIVIVSTQSQGGER